MVTKRTKPSGTIRFTGMFYCEKTKRIQLGERPIVSLDGDEYSVKPCGSGGNSLVFCLSPTQGGSDIALKLSSNFASPTPKKLRKRGCKISRFEKRVKRFRREIEALKLAKEKKHNQYIVEIFHDGEVALPVKKNGEITKVNFKTFPFYTMELADCTLTSFLKEPENKLGISEKVVLFRQLVNDIHKLHELGIYHRDIKPENILSFGANWKIGDLGLIDYREDDLTLDDINEKIGPVCRLSPEATNKFLGSDLLEDYCIERNIDESSDMYQLGLLFWYICQGEVPVGTVMANDFYYNKNHKGIFKELVQPMLQFSKPRRASVGLGGILKRIEGFEQVLGI